MSEGTEELPTFPYILRNLTKVVRSCQLWWPCSLWHGTPTLFRNPDFSSQRVNRGSGGLALVSHTDLAQSSHPAEEN